jgi:hypothetical protein
MLWAVASVALAACGPRVSYIEMEPPSFTLNARGASKAFTAIPRDASGKAVEGARPIFATLDSDIVSVDASGVVTGLKSGDARVRAMYQNVATQVFVCVSIPSSLSVTPAELVLDVGKSQAPLVRIVDEQGRGVRNPMPAESPDNRGSEPPVYWENSNAQVAKVQDGLITALAPGTANMVARAGKFEAPVKVIVRGPVVRIAGPKKLAVDVGGQVDLGVVPMDAAGNKIPADLCIWTEGQDVATLDSSRVVHGVAKGKTWVHVSLHGNFPVDVEVDVAK